MSQDLLDNKFNYNRGSSLPIEQNKCSKPCWTMDKKYQLNLGWKWARFPVWKSQWWSWCHHFFSKNTLQKQNKKRLDKSIGWVTNCKRYQARALVNWSLIQGTLSYSYLMKAFGMLVVSFRGVNSKFRCYQFHTGIAKSRIVNSS